MIQLVTVVDTTPPDVQSVDISELQPMECTGGPISVTLDVTATDLVTPSVALTYLWFDEAGNPLDLPGGQPVIDPSIVVEVAGVGDHVFRVVAVDEAGNPKEDPKPLPYPYEPGYVTLMVVDTTPPELTAALRPTWGKGKKGPDDDEGWGGSRYEVELLATDICDAPPEIMAVISQPLDGSPMEVKYKSHKK